MASVGVPTDDRVPAPVILVGKSANTAKCCVEYPLALQPRGKSGERCIDGIFDELLKAGVRKDQCYVVSDALHYKNFERWAVSHGLDVSHVLNSGRTLGNTSCSMYDLCDALASIGASSSGATIVAVDATAAFEGSVTAAVGTLRSNTSRSAIFTCPSTYESAGAASGAGLTDESSGPVTVATSQPGKADLLAGFAHAASSTSCSPVLYHLNAKAAGTLVALSTGPRSPQTGGDAGATDVTDAIARLTSADPIQLLSSDAPIFSLGARDGRPHAAESVSTDSAETPPAGSVHARAQARVGLMGNPSDGYNGKSVSLTLENFWVDVWAWASPRTRILLHPLYDPVEFRSPEELVAISEREGYSGGTRLLMAAVYRFYKQCQQHGVKLRSDTGVTLKYHTNVPRQVGLAGSSAIITAILRALAAFHGIDTDERLASADLSKPKMPGFVLAIESEELGISAGLQDRVVQWYEGLVHMDFDKEAIESQGHGTYTNLSVDALPPLFLAFAPDPSDSGRIHMPIRQRWLEGDAEVVDAMKDIASNCDATKELLAEAAAKGTPKSVVARKLGALVRRNFKGRLDLFTAPALGDTNLQMIGIGEGLGAAAKFPGSGGAVVGVVDAIGMAAKGSIDWEAGAALAADDLALVESEVDGYDIAAEQALNTLRVAYQKAGFVFVPIVPHLPTEGGGMGPVELL